MKTLQIILLFLFQGILFLGEIFIFLSDWQAWATVVLEG